MSGWQQEKVAEDGGVFDSNFSLSSRVTVNELRLDIPPVVAEVEGLQSFTFDAAAIPFRLGGCTEPALVIPGDTFCTGQTVEGQLVLTIEKAPLASHGVYPAMPQNFIACDTRSCSFRRA